MKKKENLQKKEMKRAVRLWSSHEGTNSLYGEVFVKWTTSKLTAKGWNETE